MNTQPLTELQQACDAYIIDHMTRLPNGDISVPWCPDAWPVGASSSDIAASYERVRANLRRKPTPMEVARAYRDATPTESMVTVAPEPAPEPEKKADANPKPHWADPLLFVGAVIFALAWLFLAIVGLMTLTGHYK